MSDTFAGVARISAKNEAASLRCLMSHLGAGEEVVVQTAVRPDRGWAKRLRFARVSVEPAVVDLPDPTVVAVTTRRFLLVTHSYADEPETDVLLAAPLEAVETARREGAAVVWTAEGMQYALWTNGRFAKQVEAALLRRNGDGSEPS